MARPYFPFYWGDWLRDMGVRSLSLEARGLWIDLLCHMAQGEPYGYLRSKTGAPLGLSEIARMVGADQEEVGGLIGELQMAGCADVSDDGALYSPRMARDGEVSAARSEAGSRGGSASKPEANGKQKGSKRQAKGKQNPSKALASAKQMPKQTANKPSEYEYEGITEGVGIERVTPRAREEAAEMGLEELKSVKQGEPNHLGRLWNLMTESAGLPQVRLPMKPAKGGRGIWHSANARLKEYPDLSQWVVVIERILARQFNHGHNDTGWRADFEFLCRVKTFPNYWDGKFSRPPKGTKGFDPRVGEHKAEARSDFEENRSGFTAALLELMAADVNDADGTGDLLEEWFDEAKATGSLTALLKLETKYLKRFRELLTEEQRGKLEDLVVEHPLVESAPEERVDQMLRAARDAVTRDWFRLPRVEGAL